MSCPKCREVLDRLLGRLEDRTLTRDEAAELQQRLEILRRRELARGNTDLASKITHMLIGLNGYVSGSVNIGRAIAESIGVSDSVSAFVEKKGRSK